LLFCLPHRHWWFCIVGTCQLLLSQSQLISYCMSYVLLFHKLCTRISEEPPTLFLFLEDGDSRLLWNIKTTWFHVPYTCKAHIFLVLILRMYGTMPLLSHIHIQDMVPCILTVNVICFYIFSSHAAVFKTHHCELSQPLMNVVEAISSITYICLKHTCIKQTHGSGAEAYPNVSGYSLFVLCGSQHAHYYQFLCFRCSLYLYWRCLSFS